jgi:hypothetical protein
MLNIKTLNFTNLLEEKKKAKKNNSLPSLL